MWKQSDFGRLSDTVMKVMIIVMMMIVVAIIMTLTMTITFWRRAGG
jgi:hypothetical protein